MKFTPLKPGKKGLTRRVGLKPSGKRMRSMYRAIGSPTAEQQRHQDAQRAHGCAACHLRKNRNQGGVTEIHHRTCGDLAGQKQLGQDHTCALCSWHHRSVPLPGMQAEAMRDAYGPSLALHKRDFVEWLQDVLGERSTAALQKFQDHAIHWERTE